MSAALPLFCLRDSCSITASQPIPWAQPSIRLARPLVGSRCAVAPQHRPRAPSGEPHQVPFLPALSEPGVRVGVPELVRMDLADTSAPRSVADDLIDAVVG